jgi:hypothetical protein
MKRFSGWVLTAVAVSLAHAQQSGPQALALGNTQDAARPTEIGGTPATDFVVIRASSPGAPLRFGNVVPQSERVELDGKTLRRGTDYAMDYAAGVVYLAVPAKAGSSVTVTYRYSDKPAATTSALPSVKFNLMPGGLDMTMGLGLTERTADGRVLNSNNFGFANNFRFAGGAVSGAYIYSNRERSRYQNGLDVGRGTTPGNASQDEGAAQLIVQQFRAGLAGGTVQADYQDVSANFGAFGSASNTGLTAEQIARLQAEKGLTRFGYQASNLKLGDTAVTAGFRSVGNQAGGIEWTNYGFTGGGLKASFNSQRVGTGFDRFKDLAEADREQLLRERGMERTNYAAEFAQKTTKIQFGANRIEDSATGAAIQRETVGFETGRFKFSAGQQAVTAGFGRFDSILGEEKAAYGLEAGLRRQWLALDAGLGPDTPLGYSTQRLIAPGGRFQADDVALKGKTWSLEHSARSTTTGFDGFRGMKPEEMDRNTAAIARMYGSGVNARPEDRHKFTLGAGIDRQFTSLGAKPFAGWETSFTHLQLRGRVDGGSVTTGQVKAGKFDVSFRSQKVGDQFAEFANLMDFEQHRLGSIAGLDRSDFGLRLDLGRGRHLSADRMAAETAEGGARRTSFALNDRRISVNINSREVDSGFSAVSRMNDPERDLLGTLVGARQRDATVKWQILPNFNIDAFQYDAVYGSLGQDVFRRNVALNWKPGGSTELGYVTQSYRHADSIGELFAHNVERITLTQNLGRLGRIALLDEKQVFSGRDNTQKDFHTQYVALQTKITATTDLTTEHTNKRFEDGTREVINANTVSTAVTKNAGVSVTEMAINREGSENDEKKRNYGFWIDFGKGFRLSYGYVRHLIGQEAGALTSTVALGTNTPGNSPDKVNQIQQGQAGNLMVGGGYGVNQWDADGRTQGFSNLTITTAKPFQVGFLSNVKVHFGMDQASDRAAWLRENHQASFSASLGNNVFGYEYRSQMHHSGIRGIDRTFRLSTDPDPKRKLVASVFYKVRTLPWDDQIMVRDYNITARPLKGFELSHQLQTNPEVSRGDVILGSLPQADRRSKWTLSWLQSADTTVSGTYFEQINDQSHANTRTGGLGLTLFQRSGSPLRLFYGVEQSFGNVPRRTRHRYEFEFNQRPGPNQTLSIFAGNIGYEHTIADGEARNNLTLRLNYQWRF